MTERELVLDTSFLLGIFEKKVPVSLSHLLDLVPGARLVTLTSCLGELRAKAEERDPAARSVLSSLSALGVEVRESSGPADEAIVEYSSARAGSRVVVTLDNALKNRCLERGVPVVYLRAGKRLILEDPAKFRP